MTPKEKAKDLVEKYANVNGVYGASKRCALIAVDEILDFLYDEMVSHNTYQYWRDVKNEIENL